MKSALVFASLASAAIIHSPVSYQGHKVFRIPVLENGDHIRTVIDQLELDVWQPPAKKGAYADVQVAPHKLAAFEKRMSGHTYDKMHDDLAEAISLEAEFEGYDGQLPVASPVRCRVQVTNSTNIDHLYRAGR